MYQKILMVLIQPKNTQVSTAQFRFWAKKMFTLSTTPTYHVVCHSGKPVATKECLYDVLVYCHRKSSHGGRDKTSAEVRQHYSWVPKELIARFVKHCPLCHGRRSTQRQHQQPPQQTSQLLLPPQQYPTTSAPLSALVMTLVRILYLLEPIQHTHSIYPSLPLPLLPLLLQPPTHLSIQTHPGSKDKLDSRP
ncbi:hypothetical protein BGW38_004395 [Lunasporangiospora selenospora]|uniref:Integrase zinc-binding domain-containing protein n=1 Tax=Lunasporangiospora selenospora TaxID=979761 RepID=A0A9P6FQ78_9FUNG|nr:hypothetical protein BGW38_004395 [Lunasporangiospora selenospora]